MRFDLHRHLEGSHSPRALLAVAREFGVRDALFFDEARGQWRGEAELAAALTLQAPSDDATRFYACIQKARAAYVSVAAIGALAREAFLEAAAECDGFELRVSLFSMTRTLYEREQVAWREVAPSAFAARAAEVLGAVLAARDAAEREARKPMHVRLGFSRTFESEAHYRALVGVVREQARALSGLDVLGIVTGPDREPLPPALLAILDALRPELPDLTVHAGEFEGPASVQRTLALSPQGIGHGVRAVESAQTLAELAAAGVTLEVCPMSNHLLIPTALAGLRARHGGAHPLVVLQRAHVHAVVGSDDPTPMGTDFPREWARALAAGADEATLLEAVARRWRELPRRG